METEFMVIEVVPELQVELTGVVVGTTAGRVPAIVVVEIAEFDGEATPEGPLDTVRLTVAPGASADPADGLVATTVPAGK
jgi:hypothetical protein